ncbi:hypothetical protein Hanom_Chr03g00235411 [Helianthus anomalus]
MAEEELVHVEEGPLPILKWDQRLFEQITRGFQFPPEWVARYPRQGQTGADAPPGYITLFEDLFLQGNFQLSATEFMASILHFYGFHTSQMSPAGMLRVRHFEFLCRSQGMEPTVKKFRAFYQLIRNIGFYSFGNRGAAKKILIGPPKSFHDWKMKFFFIREEVMSIAMIFRELDKIEKEELPIPKGADCYMNLLATPNQIFGEQVLVAVQMSDKWPETSEDVPVLKFNSEETQLYQAAFPTFGGSMGVHPLRSGEPHWYEQIKGNFLYPPAGVFANPPSATEGAQLPTPRPLCGVTSAGKEILLLSSEESERSKKAPRKKTSNKVTVDTGATGKKGGSSRATVAAHDKGTHRFRQSNLEDYVKKSSTTASKSSGSSGSRAPDSGATPSSIPVDDEEEHEEVEAAKLITRKRPREETATGAKPANKVVGPVIGKQSREPTGDVIPEKEKAATETAATTQHDEAQRPEVVHFTRVDQPFKEKEPEVIKPKEPEVVKRAEPSQHDAPTQTVQVTFVAGGSTATVPE